MFYGYMIGKSHIRIHKHERGYIETGTDQCGVYARKIEITDEVTRAEIDAQYDIARQRTTEAQERVNSASNPVARFFAKRRHSAAAEAEAQLFRRSDPSELLKS